MIDEVGGGSCKQPPRHTFTSCGLPAARDTISCSHSNRVLGPGFRASNKMLLVLISSLCGTYNGLLLCTKHEHTRTQVVVFYSLLHAHTHKHSQASKPLGNSCELSFRYNDTT